MKSYRAVLRCVCEAAGDHRRCPRKDGDRSAHTGNHRFDSGCPGVAEGERAVAPGLAGKPRALAWAMRPFFAMALLAVPACAAFPNGYSYCKVVTTQHTMVSGTSDLTNYPLTVILTDADLRTTGNSGLVNNGSGFDIGFYPDCSGSGAALKWEMESYSPTTGAIVAHVLRPTLSHTANDTIGMFYGGSFSSFQSTASAVWDTNYKGVWHLSSSNMLADSTGNNNLVNNGGVISAGGVVDGGASFSGSNWLNNATPTGLPTTGWITASMWVNVPYQSGNPRILRVGTFPGSAIEIAFDITHKSYVYWGDSGHYTNADLYLAGTAYLSYAFNVSTGVLKMYVNGALDASYTGLSTGVVTAAIGIGATADGGVPVIGLGDEVRVSGIERSSDWILTEYRNQSAPGTYISAGPRVAAAAGTRFRHLVTGGL